MKRIFILTIAFCLAYINLAFAEPFRSVVNVKSATDDTVLFQVGATNVVYTQSLDVKNIKNNEDTGILYRATRGVSGGVIDLGLNMQTSFKPLTDGSVDSDYVNSHIIDTSITNAEWFLVTIDTVILPYLRFQITGQGSNDARTQIQIKVSK